MKKELLEAVRRQNELHDAISTLKRTLEHLEDARESYIAAMTKMKFFLDDKDEDRAEEVLGLYKSWHADVELIIKSVEGEKEQ